MGKKSPQQTDVVVGHNVRFWRLERKMSQTDLANLLGLTFQQIQKYENGANRVGASRLMQIATALDVPIHAFFDGAGPQTDETESPIKFVGDQQALRLVRAFADIDDAGLRRSVVNLVEGIAGSEAEENGAK
ncbi:MAG: helix-turn-helix domain-containing protein [Methyloceanibacter sp.]|nr:helix-turn-helix domain-containing protein [Methyloceanibacter sp.]